MESSGGTSSGEAAGDTPIPTAGAGALLLPSGSTPDDMASTSKDQHGPPAPQGGAATALPAPSPVGGGASNGLTLSVVVPVDGARVGESISIEIAAASTAGVVDAPLHLLYDPERLRFLEASEGDYLRRDGSAIVFLANGLSRPGDVIIGIGRTDRSRGARGSGTLCRVRFEVLAPGTARLAIGPAMAWSADGSLLPVTTNAAEIQVLP